METKIQTMAEWHREEVMAIEKSYQRPRMMRHELQMAIHRPDWGAVVATRDGLVVGFVIYQFSGTQILIGRLVVHESHRRQGVGSALIDHVASSFKRRSSSIGLIVHELDVEAQFFFRKKGFKAIKVHRNYFDDRRDAFTMLLPRPKVATRTRTK